MLSRLRSHVLLAASLAWAFISTVGCEATHVVGRAPVTSSPCEAFVEGPDLRVCTASYLGASARLEGGADIGRDGSIILGLQRRPGSFDLPATPARLIDGDGLVLRLDTAGKRVLAAASLGTRILDLEVAPSTGTILVAGEPFGLAALSPQADRVLWQQPVTTDRIGVAADGRVASVNTETAEVQVWSADGARLAGFRAQSANDVTSDVAFDGASDTIIVTGALNQTPLVTPLLEGHDLQGTTRWRSYGWTAAELEANQLQAASWGRRVSMGRDGRLYYLGESRGGNTVHGRLPTDLGARAPIVGGDAFHVPFNTSRFIVFVGRFDPRTGTLESSQYILAREPDGTGNPPGTDARASAIAADALGQVLVGGHQACCGPSPNTRRVAGKKLAHAAGGQDAFVVLLPPTLGPPFVWTTWGGGGASSLVTVALAQGKALMLAGQTETEHMTGPLVTHEALQPAPSAGPVAHFFSVFRTP